MSGRRGYRDHPRGRPGGNRGRGRRGGGRGRGRGNRHFGNFDNSDGYRTNVFPSRSRLAPSDLPDRAQTNSASLENPKGKKRNFVPYSSQRPLAPASDTSLRDQDLRGKESWERSVNSLQSQQHESQGMSGPQGGGGGPGSMSGGPSASGGMNPMTSQMGSMGPMGGMQQGGPNGQNPNGMGVGQVGTSPQQMAMGGNMNTPAAPGGIQPGTMSGQMMQGAQQQAAAAAQAQAQAQAQQQQQQQLAQLQAASAGVPTVFGVTAQTQHQQMVYQMQVQQHQQIFNICTYLNARTNGTGGLMVYYQLACSNQTYLDACMKLYQMFVGQIAQDVPSIHQCNQVIAQFNNLVLVQQQAQQQAQQQQQQMLIEQQQQQQQQQAQAQAQAQQAAQGGAPMDGGNGMGGKTDMSGANGPPGANGGPPSGSVVSTPEQSSVNPNAPVGGPGGPTSPDGELDASAGQGQMGNVNPGQAQGQNPQQLGGAQVQQFNTGFQPGVPVAVGQVPGGQYFVLPNGNVAAFHGAPGGNGQVQAFGAPPGSGGQQMVPPTHIPAATAQAHAQQAAAQQQQQMLQQQYYWQAQLQQHQQMLLLQHQAALQQQQQHNQSMGAGAPPGAQAPPATGAGPTNAPQQFGAPQQAMFGVTSGVAPPGMGTPTTQTPTQGGPPSSAQNGEGVVTPQTSQPVTGNGGLSQPAPQVVEFHQELLQQQQQHAQVGPGQQFNSPQFDINSQPYMPSQPVMANAVRQEPVAQPNPQFGNLPPQPEPTSEASPTTPGGTSLSLNPNAAAWVPNAAGVPESQLNATAAVFQPQASTAPVRTASITSLTSIQEADEEEMPLQDAAAAAFGAVLVDATGEESVDEEEMMDSNRTNGFDDGEEQMFEMDQHGAEDEIVEMVDEEEYEEVQEPELTGEERLKNFYTDAVEEDIENEATLGNFSDDEDDDFLPGVGEIDDEDQEDQEEEFGFYDEDRDEMSGALVDYTVPAYDILELMSHCTDPRCQNELDNFGMEETDKRTLSKLRCDKSLISNALKAMDAALPTQGGRGRPEFGQNSGRNGGGGGGGGRSWRPPQQRRPTRKSGGRRDRHRGKPKTFLPPSANGYTVHRPVDRDELEKLKRKVRALLNKITPDKFEKLAQRLKETIDAGVTCREHFEVVLESIIDVAILQPVFAEQYAQLCSHLSAHLVPVIESWEWMKETNQRPPKYVRWVVMKTCESRHQMYFNEAKDESATEEQRSATKRNLLGTMAIIGELYNKNLMSEKIIHLCIIQPTLRVKTEGQKKDDGDESKAASHEQVTPIEMEAVCRLLTVCGYTLDSDKARSWMDLYFKVLRNESKSMENRIKFMVMDLSDLRKNRWKSILSKTKPVKLGGNSSSNGNSSRNRGDSRRGNKQDNSRKVHRYKVKGDGKSSGKHQWTAKAKSSGNRGNSSKNGGSSSSKSSSSRLNGSSNTSSRLNRTRVADNVVEHPEMPLRRSLSRTSSISSEGSSVVVGDASDGFSEMKQTENGPFLNDLKERAHSQADGYFSSHVTDDVVDFFNRCVSSENKSAVVGAMLNRIFVNKTPKEFSRLPKLFADLVQQGSVSSQELLASLQMLMESFDDDAVDAPRLPWIFGNFMADVVDKKLVDAASVVQPCKENLSNKRNFCKVMMFMADRLEACENAQALDNIQSMQIRFDRGLFDVVFGDSPGLKKYFR